MTEPKRSWGKRLRRLLARLLSAFESEPAAGGVVPNDHVHIADGVDYSLPLVVPDWVTPEQRSQLVQAAIAEAGSQFHFAFDRPYQSGGNVPAFPTAEPLREWDHQTRREVLSRCHLAYERNPLAKRAVKITTGFAVGEGFTVSYKNQDVERIVEEFRLNAENAVQAYEKELCNDLQVDGELFVRFHGGTDGQIVITTIPPWEIDWIRTEMGFQRRPVTYHQLGSQSDGSPGSFEAIDEEISAASVLHVAINRHSYHARGKSDLFAILPWLKAYKDWLENRARQNHWRDALLWDVTLTDASPQQVAAKRMQYRQPPSPGSLVVHNQKETWAPLTNQSSAGQVAEDGRQIKMMSAVGVGLPEYMLSDGENANLASATAQQLPALRNFTDYQDIMVELWRAIYRRVIEAAIEAGTLAPEVEEQDADGEPVTDEPEQPAAPPEFDPDTGLPALADKPEGKPRSVKAVEAFDVTGPELETDDPKNLAEALQIDVTQGWASNETAAGRRGYDYRIEQKKRRREMADDRDLQAQGLLPGALNNPLAGFDSEDEPGEEDEQK